MKKCDVQGRELEIGDKVSYIRSYGNSHCLEIGFIKRFTKQTVVITEKKNETEKYYENVVRNHDSKLVLLEKNSKTTFLKNCK